MIFVATHEPHSLQADSCRAIRTAIDCHSLGLDRPIKTLLVTSPTAHDGKSTVLLNLALAFVESAAASSSSTPTCAGLPCTARSVCRTSTA